MVRRLLACLALLTGLAAASAPAHAQLAQVLATQLEASERQDKAEQKQRCLCERQQREQRARRSAPQPCADEQPVTIFLPTIQLGVDRALE